MVPLFVLLATASLRLARAASNVRESDDANGSQYLAFNGTVTASVSYPEQYHSEGYCLTVEAIGPYVNSYLYVGVNPPWDPNPFFFELYHFASEYGAGGPFWLTNDGVYNLDFTSAAYSCWDGASPCGFISYGYRFEPEIVLNLTQATVKKTQIGGEDGYQVTGDQASYIKNKTRRAFTPEVDVYSQCYAMGLDFENSFVWNETFSWNYDVTFSNSSGTATISSEIRGAKMELTFTGERITNDTTFPNVTLVTEDEKKPQFKFSNDSQIYWKSTTHNSWLVAATAFPSDTSTVSTSTGTGISGLTTTASTTRASSTGAAIPTAIPQMAIPFLAVGGLLAL